MKAVLAAAILTVAVAAAVEVSPVFNYHMRYGIPLAAKIKNLEERIANQRIVGGSVTDISHTPYQLGLVISISVYTSVCGASLISPYLALTAAHCYSDGVISARSFTVVAGSNFLFSGGQRIDTTDVTMHPGWNPQTIENDVAVVRVSGFGLSNLVQTIALPSGNELSDSYVGWYALASGYGATSDNSPITGNQVLSSVTIPVITLGECRAVYGGWIPDTNICTSGGGGRGTCGGDSGGPLVVESQGRRILIGVTSFGAAAGCEAGFPAAFARVTSYIDWILSFN